MSNFIVDPYRFAVGEEQFEQLTGTENSVQKNSVDGGVGIGINSASSVLVGKKPTKFSTYSYREGSSPVGNAYAVICDYRDDPPLDNILSTSTTIPMSSFGSGSGNIGWMEFTFDGSVALEQYHTIALIYNSSPDHYNYIVTKMQNSSQPFDTGKCFMNLWTESIWLVSRDPYPTNYGSDMSMRFKLTTEG